MRMSLRGKLVLLAVLASMVAACGQGATAPVGGATPQVAWDERGTVHLVQGDVERTIEGQWEPWLWLPNGDLLLHTPSDSSGMGVYRPRTGDFVTKTDDEWGRDKYDGGEYGLDGETGVLTATDVLLRIVDGDEPATPDQGPPHYLVDYDYRLGEEARVELPAADDPSRYRRDYDFPVRVGAVTFATYEDSVFDGPLSDNPGRGIVRVEGGAVTTPAKDVDVRRLFLSSDASSVLAIVGGAPADEGTGDPTLVDPSRTRVVELDPVTGEIARELAVPEGYGEVDWEIERVDEVGGQVAVQIAEDCTAGGSGTADTCPPRRTWVTDGSGWTEVTDQRGGEWYWQGPTTSVSWATSGANNARTGPIGWADGSTDGQLAPKKASHRVVSGGLLPPV